MRFVSFGIPEAQTDEISLTERSQTKHGVKKKNADLVRNRERRSTMSSF